MISTRQKAQNLTLNPGKWFRSSLLVLFSFFLSIFVSASESKNTKEYSDAGSITIGGESQGFTIGKGETVKLIAGEYIRLLPGTHIEAGSNLTIEVSKDVKPSKTEVSHTVMLLPELLFSTSSLKDNCHFTAFPDNEKQLRNSLGYMAVLPLPVTSHTKNLLSKKIYNSSQIFSGSLSLSNTIYTPLLSWGERPETIKVLRT